MSYPFRSLDIVTNYCIFRPWLTQFLGRGCPLALGREYTLCLGPGVGGSSSGSWLPSLYFWPEELERRKLNVSLYIQQIDPTLESPNGLSSLFFSKIQMYSVLYFHVKSWDGFNHFLANFRIMSIYFDNKILIYYP